MVAFKNLFLVLISPGEVFERLKEKPSWWLPFVILIIATIVLTIATAPIGKEIALQQMEKQSDSMSSEQLAQSKQMIESPFMAAFSVLAALIATVAAVFVQVGIIHFLLSALGGSATFVSGLAVVLYANVPTIVRQFVEAAYAFNTHKMMKTGIVGMFPGVEQISPMGTFLGSIDIFVACQYILLAIGCSIVYKVSKGKTGAVAFGLWATGVIISVGFAFLGSSYGSGSA